MILGLFRENSRNPSKPYHAQAQDSFDRRVGPVRGEKSNCSRATFTGAALPRPGNGQADIAVQGLDLIASLAQIQPNDDKSFLRRRPAL